MPHVVDDLELEIPADQVVRRLRLPGEADPLARARELTDRLLPLARPRAAYVQVGVGERGEDFVELGEHRIRSRLLAEKLREVGKVFLYVVTLGPDLEEEVRGIDDPLEQYYLDEMGSLALARLTAALARRLAEQEHLPELYSLSPGSLPDWPIEEQRKVFALLGDTQAAVGVRLGKSLLMTPRKTVSGILFPSEVPFTACALCPTRNCPSRKVPFDPAARKEHERART